MDFIADCLKSLEEQTHDLAIVVVDNGSNDGSREVVENNFPKVKLLKLDHNTGFTGGVNTGITYALNQNAEFIILFNNDAIAEKTWAHELISEAIKHPKAGIVTSKFLRMDKIYIDSTGEGYTTRGLPFPRGRNEKDQGQYDDLNDIFAATGGASLYRATLLKEIGLFDQDFFAYYEDVDISFRAQLAGWGVRYAPRAVAYHHMSGTSSKLGDFVRFHSAKNFLLVYAKNMPRKLYFKYLPLFVFQLCRMAFGSLLRGKLRVFLKGSLAAISLHPATMNKRKNIQSSRKVSVAYIDTMLTHRSPPKPPVILKAGRE